MGGKSKSAKELYTRITRRLCYLPFVYNAHLTDNLTLSGASNERCLWQFAWYTMHLATGSPIQCRTLKCATIEKYLLAAAQFIAQYTGFDPRCHPGDRSIAPEIQCILNELKRWEGMRDLREPYTIEMQNAFDKTNNESNTHHDALDAALSDWFAVGQSIGPRISEWAQPQSNKGNICDPSRKDNGAISAFLLPDVTFFKANREQVTTEEALHFGVDKLHRVRIRWRFQKNGVNGETKTHLRNDKATTLCMVRRMFSIIERYIRLIGYNNPEVHYCCLSQ